MSQSIASYVQNTRWTDYLRFFPERWRERLDDLVEEHVAWRGIDLHVDRLPDPSAQVKVILVHGAGAYGRVLAPFASTLGVEALAPDLPGYGLSRTNGRVVSYEDWVDCLAHLVLREKTRDPRPIVLLGGSMGGLLAYSVAARGDVDGVIATCLLDPRSEDVRRAISRWPSLLGLGLPLLRTGVLDRLRVPIRWLTKMSRMANDPAVGALCAADPLGGGGSVSLRWVRTFMASAPTVEPEHFDACPILLAHPANDTWTPLRVTQPFYDRLACDKALVLLEGSGHVPVEEPGISQLDAAVRAFLERIAPRT